MLGRLFPRHLAALLVAAGLVALAPPTPAAAETVVSHALAEFGEPAYGPDFRHFDYADPDAPKGGAITIGAPGSFDTLNSLPLGGEAPRSLGLLYDTLMVGAQDEIGALYGLIAERVEYPEDRGWVIFHLRPEARFHDGTPITAGDVAWTFEQTLAHGRPFLRAFFDDVTGVETVDERTVRFRFSTTGTMQPLLRVAGLSVYPRHWWEAEGRDISRSTLQPPLGSGPYRIARVDGGRNLVYERVEDYWAADLPVNRGLWNFDRITYQYYRDQDVQFEAFKAGAYDFRQEYTSHYWATGYDIAAAADGRLIRAEIPTIEIRGMQSYMFNTRLERFRDPHVREALGLLYDFEWVNANLFHGNYERLRSFFNAPGYASGGLPDGLELEILERYRDRLPEEVFTAEFVPPVTDGSGNVRAHIRRALELMDEAGWEVRNNVLTHRETGERMSFEILLRGAALQRVTQPFLNNLRRIGVEATMRVVDSAQWQRRYQDRDFEVIVFAYTFYPPPGVELRSYFGSAAADIPGSANVAGIQDPVVDALIEEVIAATDLETKQAATRALDRVLLWSHYVVPNWTKNGSWIAYWNRFGFPDTHPPYDFGMPNGIAFQPTWWIDPDRNAALARGG